MSSYITTAKDLVASILRARGVCAGRVNEKRRIAQDDASSSYPYATVAADLMDYARQSNAAAFDVSYFLLISLHDQALSMDELSDKLQEHLDSALDALWGDTQFLGFARNVRAVKAQHLEPKGARGDRYRGEMRIAIQMTHSIDITTRGSVAIENITITPTH